MSGSAQPFVVPADHPALPGHFPGRPVVPGVVLLAEVLERIAAAAGLSSPAPARLRRVKFTAPVLPGEPVDVELRPGPSGGVAFTCSVGDRRVATGTAEVGPAPPAPAPAPGPP